MGERGKVVGRAVTIKITAAGLTKGKQHHLGIGAIEAADKGDIISLITADAWTPLAGAEFWRTEPRKGLSAVVVDGQFGISTTASKYSSRSMRGTVVATASGRIMEEATNVMIQFAGVQVRPGDVVMGDRSGVVIVPQEKLDEVHQSRGILR